MDKTLIKFIKNIQKAIEEGRCVETNNEHRIPIIHVKLSDNKIRFELKPYDDNDSIIETFYIEEKDKILDYVIIL
tara:strand:+ start:116 stop:340 length:225 start_codon:yes stop_codon:yes gene_type:complete